MTHRYIDNEWRSPSYGLLMRFSFIYSVSLSLEVGGMN